MSGKLRALAVILGLAIAVTINSAVNRAEVAAQEGCENQDCIRGCVGDWCFEDCYDWSDKHCAGGSGWCVSVWCPIIIE